MADEVCVRVAEAAQRLGMDEAAVRAALKSYPHRLRGFKRPGSSLWSIPVEALQEYADLCEAEYEGAFR